MNARQDSGLAATHTESSTFVSRDPRFLIVLLVFLLVFTFLIGRTLGLLLLLGYIFILYPLSGLPLRQIGKGARNVLLFGFIIVVINAFLAGGTPLPTPLSFLSVDGVIKGLYYSARVAVLYFTLMLFFSVTSQEGLACGLAALLVPFSRRFSRRVAMHGFLSIGFLPLFRDELNRIRVAQRFRGGGIEGSLLQRLVGARTLIVPLLVSAIHRSGQLAMAVELRGIKNSIDRILVLEKPSIKDFVFAGVTVFVLFIAINV